jgi:hypothetical protein
MILANVIYSLIVMATVITIVNYNHTVIRIVNYDPITFIVQATNRDKLVRLSLPATSKLLYYMEATLNRDTVKYLTN